MLLLLMLQLLDVAAGSLTRSVARGSLCWLCCTVGCGWADVPQTGEVQRSRRSCRAVRDSPTTALPWYCCSKGARRRPPTLSVSSTQQHVSQVDMHSMPYLICARACAGVMQALEPHCRQPSDPLRSSVLRQLQASMTSGWTQAMWPAEQPAHMQLDLAVLPPTDPSTAAPASYLTVVAAGSSRPAAKHAAGPASTSNPPRRAAPSGCCCTSCTYTGPAPTESRRSRHQLLPHVSWHLQTTAQPIRGVLQRPDNGISCPTTAPTAAADAGGLPGGSRWWSDPTTSPASLLTAAPAAA